MTRSAVAAFGALRFADEHELEACEIYVRARLTKGQGARALADLRREGLVHRRIVKDGGLRRRFYRLQHA